jgi:hypothetical protein
MVGPVRAEGVLEVDPDPPDAHGVECAPPPPPPLALPNDPPEEEGPPPPRVGKAATDDKGTPDPGTKR